MAKGKYEEWLEPEGLLKIQGWARDGLTEEQIAYNMGIRRSTLSEWKKKFPDILDSLKRGKEIVDIEVENALLSRALGYEYVETTQERIIDFDEHGKRVGSHMEVTKKVTKRMAPDVTAQIFWLKNRKPNEWRDKREVDVGGQDGNSLKVEFVGDIKEWSK